MNVVRFHRRTDLALLALRTLAGSEGGLAGAMLAGRVGTTVFYLPQVMAPLIRAEWVSSGRGPHGGYRLTEKAAEASLLDVIEVTGGSSDDRRCVFRDAPCPGDHPCPVHALWLDARETLEAGFDEIPAITPRGAKT